MIGIGLALAKFTEGITSTAGGLGFEVLGLIIMLYTGFRYYQVESALRRGEFSINMAGVCLMVALFSIASILCVLYLVVEIWIDTKHEWR